MACNIISGTIIVGISIFFFHFFSVCGARIRVFFSGTFLRVLVSGSKNIPRVDTHVRLIVRRETCVTISDDGKVELRQQCNAGKDDHISVRVLGRRSGFFFLPSANNNGRKPKKKKIEKKKRKDPSGWTAISSWFDIKGFGVVSFEGRDFFTGIGASWFIFSYTFFLCSHSSQQGNLCFSLGTLLVGRLHFNLERWGIGTGWRKSDTRWISYRWILFSKFYFPF